MFLKYKLKNYNFRLVLWTVMLNIFGIIAISSANSAYTKKQIFGMALGIIVMVFISLLDYEFILKFSWIIYGINILMLGIILLPVFGDSAKGAQRWIQVGGFRFQPSELAKIFIILFFAFFFAKIHEKINTGKFLLMSLILAGVPLVLIKKQPDLSTTIVITLMICFMIFAAGLSWKIVGGVLAVAIPAAIIAFSVILTKGETFLDHYQYLRIMAWLRPKEYSDSALQQQNSITAIGSGQIFGKGLYNSEAASLKNGNFISEPHTDFIFAIVGEELGFLGCVFIIILLLFICMEIIIIAKKAKNLEGSLIAVGVASLIAIQSFVNISVTTGIFPTTGVTLPFVSYGLTSLVSMYIGIGLALNVGLQPRKYNSTGVRT